ncbi:MAG TPA: hypothetical protein VHJ34_02820 [Actinomycetota bacterium]|nr:hypothetical protein [Actinomycetota bacterium]
MGRCRSLRRGGALAAAALLAVACTGDASPASAPRSRSGATTAADPDSFEPPSRARPPRAETKLSARHVSRCLYRDRLPASALAYRYFGPTDLVADQLETSRELDVDVPEIEYLDPAEFDRRYGREPGAPRGREYLVTRWLSWALGLTPHGLDVDYVLAGTGTELVAGLYEHDTERIVVKQTGDLDAEYTVLAHELAHAAVDQRFGLEDLKPAHVVDDVTLARRAVVEGDATLAEMRLLSRLSPPKVVRKAVAATLASAESFRTESALGIPRMLTDEFVFPYRWGLAFACSVFRARDWGGVDSLHRRPPTSTAEVMFPERFLRGDGPDDPARLGAPGAPFSLRATGQIGAFHLNALFEAPGDVRRRALTNPLGRAASWDGGAFKLWATDELDSVVGLSLVEHRKHRGVLCASMNAWYRAAFFDAERELVADRTMAYSDDDQKAVVKCDGRSVRVAMAPTEELARAVAR